MINSNDAEGRSYKLQINSTSFNENKTAHYTSDTKVDRVYICFINFKY